MPYLVKGQNRYNLNPELATVASTGDYNDLLNKPDMGFVEYDDTQIYTDGDYVMVNGETYKVDSENGTYIEMGENLYVPTKESETYIIDNKYAWFDAWQWTADNTNYKIVRVNNLQVGEKYRLYARYEPSVNSNMCGVGFQSNGQSTTSPYPIYNSNGYTDFQLTTSGYFGISIHKGYESEYRLYRLSSQKLKQVTITSDIQNLEDNKAEKTDVNTSIEEILAIIAPTYDITSGTYDIGDYVIYNNGLYKCNTTISTPEVFDSSKWDSTTIMQVIKTLEARLV